MLPYQVEGVLHLAFGERALLRELRGVERVSVASPASLKAEWEEQIATFSDLPSAVVFGGSLARSAAYARHTFFTLCNYEQVVAEGKELRSATATWTCSRNASLRSCCVGARRTWRSSSRVGRARPSSFP